MGFKQIGALLLLSAVWGGAFRFMRIAAPVLGPVLLSLGSVILVSSNPKREARRRVTANVDG